MAEKTLRKTAAAKRHAVVNRGICAACGACEAVCPRGAIHVWRGSFSVVEDSLCVGCGRCARECPASATASPWAFQFAYGFYSLMLTSALLGILTMLFYKPRSWCVYCPMGTMTQLICKAKAVKSKVPGSG